MVQFSRRRDEILQNDCRRVKFKTKSLGDKIIWAYFILFFGIRGFFVGTLG